MRTFIAIELEEETKAQLAEVQEAQQRAEKSGRSLEEELDDLRNASNKVEEATEKMGDGFTITGRCDFRTDHRSHPRQGSQR